MKLKHLLALGANPLIALNRFALISIASLLMPAQPAVTQTSSQTMSHQAAFERMESYIGLKEVPGPNSHPLILEMHHLTSLKAKSDSVAWCSSGMNWAMEYAGFPGTASAVARSWLEWGREVSIENARKGDVIVLARGTQNWQGHVAFLIEFSADDRWVKVLGANQKDSISVATYDASKLLGIRRHESEFANG